MKRSTKIIFTILLFALVTVLCSCSVFIYGNSRFEGGEALDEELLSKIENDIHNNVHATEDTVSELPTESHSESRVESDTTVYWTSSGSVWHTRRDCSYIKNSENIHSGTTEDAISNGKKQLCSSCQKH